jgi:RNA polymerase sigma factor (TIGR02999 family)
VPGAVRWYAACRRRPIGTMDPNQVSALLTRTMAGEADAEQALTGVIYDELRRIAEWLMAQERRDHTLQATALVHEAYVRLSGAEGVHAGEAEGDRFLGLAARVMRNILVDHARGRNRLKRGGGGGGGSDAPARVALGAGDPAAPAGTPPEEILALHEAVEKLERLDSRKARLVELRFFGGLDEAQAARVLGIARSTAAEDWRFARAWLAVEMGRA